MLRWLAATWQMMSISTVFGWTMFQVPRDPKEWGDPLSWPSATLTIDQGGDGWSAGFFLASLFLNIIIFPDMSHRVWNDVQLSIQDCGWWYILLLLVAIQNLDHGPWGAQKWFNETKDAVKQYLSVTTRACPLFQGSLDDRKLKLHDNNDNKQQNTQRIHTAILSRFLQPNLARDGEDGARDNSR